MPLRLNDKAISDFTVNGYLLFREPVFDPADFEPFVWHI